MTAPRRGAGPLWRGCRTPRWPVCIVLLLIPYSRFTSFSTCASYPSENPKGGYGVLILSKKLILYYNKSTMKSTFKTDVYKRQPIRRQPAANTPPMNHQSPPTRRQCKLIPHRHAVDMPPTHPRIPAPNHLHSPYTPTGQKCIFHIPIPALY